MSSSISDPADQEVSQVLLKRNLAMTRAQFSDHWYQKHAALVIPYFLEAGIKYYAQIHNIRLNSGHSLPDGDSTDNWDGAAELVRGASTPPSGEGMEKFYEEVILVDERRFLVSEALQHCRVVPPATCNGERRVIIQGGKLADGIDIEWAAAKVLFQEYMRKYVQI